MGFFPSLDCQCSPYPLFTVVYRGFYCWLFSIDLILLKKKLFQAASVIKEIKSRLSKHSSQLLVVIVPKICVLPLESWILVPRILIVLLLVLVIRLSRVHCGMVGNSCLVWISHWLVELEQVSFLLGMVMVRVGRDLFKPILIGWTSVYNCIWFMLRICIVLELGEGTSGGTGDWAANSS